MFWRLVREGLKSVFVGRQGIEFGEHSFPRTKLLAPRSAVHLQIGR